MAPEPEPDYSSSINRTNTPLSEIVHQDEGVYEEPKPQPTRRRDRRQGPEVVERQEERAEYTPPPPSEILVDEEARRGSSKGVRRNQYGDIVEE